MLLSAAVLDLELFIDRMPAYPLGLKVLTECSLEGFSPAFEAYRHSFKDDNMPLLQIIVDDFLWSEGTDLS